MSDLETLNIKDRKIRNPSALLGLYIRARYIDSCDNFLNRLFSNPALSTLSSMLLGDRV